MLHWFADLMNVTEEVTIHRPNVSTLLSSAFIIEYKQYYFVRFANFAFYVGRKIAGLKVTLGQEIEK